MGHRSWAWLGWAVHGMGHPCRAAQYQAGLLWFCVSHSIGPGLCMVWLTGTWLHVAGLGSTELWGFSSHTRSCAQSGCAWAGLCIPTAEAGWDPTSAEQHPWHSTSTCLGALTTGGCSQEMAVPGWCSLGALGRQDGFPRTAVSQQPCPADSSPPAPSLNLALGG